MNLFSYWLLVILGISLLGLGGPEHSPIGGTILLIGFYLIITGVVGMMAKGGDK